MIDDLPPPHHFAPHPARPWKLLLGFAAGFAGSVALLVWWLT
jgi:hypothetical protein